MELPNPTLDLETASGITCGKHPCILLCRVYPVGCADVRGVARREELSIDSQLYGAFLAS